jgi:hypothetical protein
MTMAAQAARAAKAGQRTIRREILSFICGKYLV